MRWQVFVILAAGFSITGIAGCSGGTEQIVAEEPQADNQKEKTRPEQVKYLMGMLKSPEEKKVERAIYWLNEFGADSTIALGDLEAVARRHSSAKVKDAATKAIEKIKAAAPE